MEPQVKTKTATSHEYKDPKGLDHAALSDIFNADEERVNWHDETLWWIRAKRDRAVHQLPEWEHLRETASRIKHNVLSNMSNYLQQFEANAIANGITVHWAANAAEHNQIVLSILRKHDVKRMVKSKSMLTEECHLNEYLGENGTQQIVPKLLRQGYNMVI